MLLRESGLLEEDEGEELMRGIYANFDNSCQLIRAAVVKCIDRFDEEGLPE
jgi:hypothetical protein